MAEYAYAGELVDCGDDATSRKRFEMMGHDEYLNQCERELDNNYWEIAEVNLLNDWPSPEEYKPVEATGMSADVIAAWLTLIVMAKAKK